MRRCSGGVDHPVVQEGELEGVFVEGIDVGGVSVGAFELGEKGEGPFDLEQREEERKAPQLVFMAIDVQQV